MNIPLSVYKRLPTQMPLSLGFSKYALHFGGIGYVKVLRNPSLDLALPFTLEAVVKRTADFAMEADIIRYQANYGLYSTGLEELRANYYDGGAWRSASSGYFFPLNEFVSLSCTFVANGANTDITFFVNGTQYGAVHTVVGQPTPSVSDLYLGSNWAGVALWIGVIDEFRIYNRLLSQTERLYNLLNYHTPIMDGCVLLLRMEEGTGLTIYDDSGLGNDGSLLPVINPPTWRRNRKWELRAEAGL